MTSADVRTLPQQATARATVAWFAAYLAVMVVEWFISSPFNASAGHFGLPIGMAAGVYLGWLGVAVTAAAELVFNLSLRPFDELPYSLVLTFIASLHVAFATGLWRLTGLDPRLAHRRDIFLLMGVGVLGCGALTFTMRALLGWALNMQSPPLSFLFGMTAPSVTLLPMLLLLVGGEWRVWRAAERTHKLHTLTVLLIVACISVMSFYWLPTQQGGVRRYKFLSLLPILWAALRLGLFETACLSFVSNLLAIVATVVVTIQLAPPGQIWQVDYSDLVPFMMLLAAAGLLLAALTREEADARRRLESALKQVRTSEQLYRDMIMHAPMPMLMHLEDSIQIANPEMVRMLGASSEQELLGLSGTSLAAPEDKQESEQWLAEVKHSKNPYHRTPMNVRWQRRNGEVFDVRFSSGALTLHGQSGAIVVATDISESQRLERELRDRELVYHSVVSVTSDAIFDINLKTNTLTCSEAAYDLFRVPRDQLPNAMQWWQEHIEPSERERVTQSLRSAVFGTGALWGCEYWLHRNDGEPMYVSARARILRSESGTAYRVIGAVTDLTQLRLQREEIEKLNTNLERRVMERTAELALANQELEAFSYSVSHDLRAPLRAVDGFSRAVIEDYGEQLDTRGRDYLERVRAASQRMAGLIDDLLALSRVARSTLVVGVVDLSALATEIVDELRAGDTQRQVQVRIEPGLIVSGDAGLLRIMLENLLSNAWKFTSKQTNPVISFMRVPMADVELVFCVQDNGAGFDMRFVDKLFGAFQRLHSNDEFPGTGVGLATVQRVVRRHHGRVWAESQLGQGARFYFSIPTCSSGDAQNNEMNTSNQSQAIQK